MHSELEELHRQASVHYLKGQFAEAMSAWRKVLEVQPDDERGREGMRLCEQLAGEIDAARAASNTDSAAEPVADAPPEIDGSAESELLKRIEALMEEARTFGDEGEVGKALSAIDRVLILDEENEAALALREHFEQASADPVASEELHQASEPSGSEQPLDIGVPEIGASGSGFRIRPYPNPSAGPVFARFEMPEAGAAICAVIYATGRRGALLGRGTWDAGPGELVWNGQDSRGNRVAPGVYFVRGVLADGRSTSGRVVLRR